jgi:cobalt-zinc-cadmium efflux system outer membrane protein
VAWSVSVAQPFEYPGRLALRKAIANRQIELAQIGYQQFQAALAARVRILGFGLMIAQERAEAAREVAERGKELVEVLVHRDPAGVEPLLETRIIEASVITLNRDANEAVEGAQKALFELNQLRGKPLAAPLTMSKTELRFPPLPAIEELVTAAATNNIELRMRQVELAQQGFRVQLLQNERWPTLTLAPFYTEEKPGDDERTFGVGVSVPLPLWNRNGGNIEAAHARQKQAETSLLVSQREVERNIRERAAAYEVQWKEMSRWQTNVVQQLREAAALGDRHYRLGAIPISTYVELQEKYLEGLEAILDTRAEALEHLQQLELVTGVRIAREEAK